MYLLTSYKVLEDADKNATSITAVISVSDRNKEEITTERAEALAYWLANAVGTDVSNVVINDDEGHNIFNGSLDDGLGVRLRAAVPNMFQSLGRPLNRILSTCF